MLAELRLLRPKQWVKNLFVFLGIVFAGQLFTPALYDVLLVFVVFCLASSTIYIINDIRDAPQDRRHKKKKYRPIAAGKVTVARAWTMAAILAVLVIASAFLISTEAIIIVGLYLILNLAYTFSLKHVVIIDAFSIAFGFVLRVLAGTMGVSIPTSSWLAITIIALSLFLGFSKRMNEKQTTAASHRKVLKHYTIHYLTTMTTSTAILSIVFYSLYVAELKQSLAFYLSIPLVIFGFFRYLYLMELPDRGGDPTEELFRDWPLIITIVLWGILILLGGQ